MTENNQNTQAQQMLEKVISDLELLLNKSPSISVGTSELIYGCLCSINGLVYTGDRNLTTAFIFLTDLLQQKLHENSSTLETKELN